MTSEVNANQDQSHPRRAKVGQVQTISGGKTINVVVENLVKHQRYGKYIRRRTKLAVHDEHGKAKVGDMVEIVPCRPISKSKAHRLVKVVRSAVAE
jgi:small subunit ribosomal protein S17